MLYITKFPSIVVIPYCISTKNVWQWLFPYSLSNFFQFLDFYTLKIFFVYDKSCEYYSPFVIYLLILLLVLLSMHNTYCLFIRFVFCVVFVCNQIYQSSPLLLLDFDSWWKSFPHSQIIKEFIHIFFWYIYLPLHLWPIWKLY